MGDSIPFRTSLRARIEPAWLDRETAAHGTDRKDRSMLGDERVPHFASLAKYAAAFLGCHTPRSPVPVRASTGGSRPIGHPRPNPLPASRTSCATRRGNLCDAQSLRNFRHRVASFGHLMHRTVLELVAEPGVAHRGLLASNLGKKASRNLGAIHWSARRAWRADGTGARRRTGDIAGINAPHGILPSPDRIVCRTGNRRGS
jgi:hypothetical protein